MDGGLITRERTAGTQRYIPRPQSRRLFPKKRAQILRSRQRVSTRPYIYLIYDDVAPSFRCWKRRGKGKKKGKERRKEKNEKPKRRRGRRKMKRIMYFHLFQSNNPALPVENVDSRISLVTTLGWISRVQLFSPSVISNFD